jgi:hypothetical protein
MAKLKNGWLYALEQAKKKCPDMDAKLGQVLAVMQATKPAELDTALTAFNDIITPGE